MTGQPETVADLYTTGVRVWLPVPLESLPGVVRYAGWMTAEKRPGGEFYHASTEAEVWLWRALAAARAEAFAEIRRGVEGLAFRAITGSSLDERGIHGDLSCDWDEYLDLLDRAAVLALLPSVSPEDRG